MASAVRNGHGKRRARGCARCREGSGVIVVFRRSSCASQACWRLPCQAGCSLSPVRSAASDTLAACRAPRSCRSALPSRR
eukprot:3097637-Prorocentrum_lima.AAC.1